MKRLFLLFIFIPSLAFGQWSRWNSGLKIDSLNVTGGIRTSRLYVDSLIERTSGSGIKIKSDLYTYANVTLAQEAAEEFFVKNSSGNTVIYIDANDSLIAIYGVDDTTNITPGKYSITKSDKDQADITMNTSDHLLFSNAANYVFDSDVSINDSLDVNGHIITADNKIIGLGKTKARIEFDDQTTDEVNILSANVGIGTQAPDHLLDITGIGNLGLIGADAADTTIIDSAKIVLDGSKSTITISQLDSTISLAAEDTTRIIPGLVSVGSNPTMNYATTTGWGYFKSGLEVDGSGYFTGTWYGNNYATISNGNIVMTPATGYDLVFPCNNANSGICISSAYTIPGKHSLDIGTIGNLGLTGIDVGTDSTLIDSTKIEQIHGGYILNSISAEDSGFVFTNIRVNTQYDTWAEKTDTAGLSLSMTDGVPDLKVAGSDGKSWDISINTSGHALFSNATNYVFDTDVSVGDSLDVDGNVIIADNKIIGFSKTTGRIEFDDLSTDEINILSANLGIGTSTPDHLIDVYGTSDIAITSVDGADSLVADSNDVRIIKGGYNKRINWGFEGWCTHEADTVTIGVLPANAIVTNLLVWVQEAFDSDGTDYLYVGYDGDEDAYGTELDVSTTGVKAMTLGATSKTVDGTSRTVKVYYAEGGSDAANGEVHVVIEWFQATVNP